MKISQQVTQPKDCALKLCIPVRFFFLKKMMKLAEDFQLNLPLNEWSLYTWYYVIHSPILSFYSF